MSKQFLMGKSIVSRGFMFSYQTEIFTNLVPEIPRSTFLNYIEFVDWPGFRQENNKKKSVRTLGAVSITLECVVFLCPKNKSSRKCVFLFVENQTRQKKKTSLSHQWQESKARVYRFWMWKTRSIGGPWVKLTTWEYGGSGFEPWPTWWWSNFD